MKTTLVEAMKRLDFVDFRVKGRTKHLASEIAIITLCSIISGGTSYYDFAEFGCERIDWLKTFLTLRNGIPSHDTFKRFWSRLPPAAFNACFMTWLDSFVELEDGDGIHIDGKCLRCAIAPSGKTPCIVSAYSSKERIVIGQVKTDEKSNEITAIPNLLDELYLTGCIVTIDAAGCQKKIVKKICSKHADYLIALKNNQPNLLDSMKELFVTKFKDRATRFAAFEQTVKGHGRLTTRRCCQTDYLEWMTPKERGAWANLASICQIETETINTKTGQVTKESRYFISSLSVDPKKALATAVAHWDVENPLHWTLDMVFDEDHSRARDGFAAENLAIMRHIAFNMIRLDAVTQGGIKRKKKSMTWNQEKLLKALLAA